MPIGNGESDDWHEGEVLNVGGSSDAARGTKGSKRAETAKGAGK